MLIDNFKLTGAHFRRRGDVLSGFGDHVVTLSTRVLMYLVSDSTPASFCSLRNINNTTPVSFLDSMLRHHSRPGENVSLSPVSSLRS